MKKNDAVDLFLKKEQRELQGRKQRNLVILSMIFLVAILSIGFGSASLRYLKHKMEDRFVSCVDITVDQVYSQGYDKLNEFVSTPEIQSKYGIDSTERVWQFCYRFYTVDGQNSQLDGRSCSAKSPILTECVLNNENVVVKSLSPLHDDDFAIIVSLDGLKKLGYDGDEYPSMLSQYVYVDMGISHSFGVPVYAIVKELPDMCDFMATEAWYLQDIADNCNNFDVSLEQYNKQLQLCVSDSVSEQMAEKLRDSGFDVKEQAYDYSWNPDHTLLTVQSDRDDRAAAFDSLSRIYGTQDGILRVYDFSADSLTLSRKPQIYSCFFKRDSIQYHVEDFRKQLKSETGYNLDMAKINSLKNLAYVQAMGSTLSVCIILIAIVFISVFVNFLLNSHFQKIQRNLGTFKAFGMTNKDLKSIYTRILLRLILLSFAIAAALSILISLLLKLIAEIEHGYPWIDIFVWQNALLLIATLLVAFVTTIVVSNRLFKETPGDLIYNRNI